MKPSILSRLRNSKFFKGFCAFTALNFVMQSLLPQQALALTSGPSQPEVQSFEPVGTTDMVNLFSGDFVYNIPLFELPGPNGGYPFNLAYHSGIGMDQEASWVGLGWNLNPGAINRSMRGLPDDFNGDELTYVNDMKPMETWGAGGGFGIEVAGADDENGIGYGNSLTVYQNNYKGVGYSLSQSVSTALPGSSGFGLSFSRTLSNQEGIGADLNLSLQKDYGKEVVTGYGLGIGFNSLSGVNVNTSLTKAKYKDHTSYMRVQGIVTSNVYLMPKVTREILMTRGTGSYISFSTPAYTPAQTVQRTGQSYAVTVKKGAGSTGVFSNVSIRGFYNIDQLQFPGIPQKQKAYGVHYLQEAEKVAYDKGLMDYNRSKDGRLYPTSPNLPVPNLSFDYYNVQGQGIGGMFRPYRSEIGHVHSPAVVSRSIGLPLGLDFGAPGHFGGQGASSTSNTTTGPWKTDNNLYGNYQYSGTGKAQGVADYEPVYYKMLGEQTSFATNEMDYLRGEDPVRAELSKTGFFLDREYNLQGGHLNNGIDKQPVGSWQNARRADERRSRNQPVQPLVNEQLLSLGTAVLGEYNIAYYPEGNLNSYQAAPATALNRETRASNEIKSHYAGFTLNSAAGQRYIYGLPAYNLEQDDFLYSYGETGTNNAFCAPNVAAIAGDPDMPKYKYTGTDEFLSKTSLPSYAHAYLLTSILGADYVDVTNDGPTDDDYGYWVKFNYVKTNDDYRWRSPFEGANYSKGYMSNLKDDKANFSTGTKEVYHLATAETKTHIAVFQLQTRNDGYGAKAVINNAGDSKDTNNPSYKLTSVSLFKKDDYQANGLNATAITKVVFGYADAADELCQSVQNGDNGKLTLTSLTFQHGKDNRGVLSPYEFAYHSGDPHAAPQYTGHENPPYDPSAYDRWGNFKANDGGICDNYLYPYVEQFDRDVHQTEVNKSTFRENADDMASAWHLKQIKLPTGGIMKIDYEADDYAYVQHKKALQMFTLAEIGDWDCMSSSNEQNYYQGQEGTGTPDQQKGIDNESLKLYFDLEAPIDATSDPTSTIKKQYLDPLFRDGEYQLYYKVKLKLRGELYEYISGYVNLDMSSTSNYGGACPEPLDLDGDGTAESYYTKGFVTLKKLDIGGEVDYHPFAVAAWQSMRINYPHMLTKTLAQEEPPASASDQARQEKVENVFSIVPQMKQLFSGYRQHAFKGGWARQIVLDESWIRLGTPDGIKLGGGSRVKQIALSSQWDQMRGEATESGPIVPEFGQVFDYTIPDEDGQLISSGVAQNEPHIGADENALRFAKLYPEHLALKTDNNLFVEYPINEANYPGAGVGYRRVTVRSMATANVMESATPGTVNSTTGVTENNFYTAKDFPVIEQETNNQTEPYHLPLLIPFIGQVMTKDLTASQGYVVKLNDMHGRPRSVKHYELDYNGEQVAESISSVKYDYFKKRRRYQDTWVFELDNEVPTLSGNKIPQSNGNEQFIPENKLVGVDYDFVMDMQENSTHSTSFGVNFNIDEISGTPFSFPWPQVNDLNNTLRTAVMNKIIHKTALLKKTTATNGLSTVETKNTVFDALTGAVVMTEVKNDYGDPVYAHNIPAHWEYGKMGPAYKNLGFRFYAMIDDVQPGSNGVFTLQSNDLFFQYADLFDLSSGSYDMSPSTLYEHLVEGDEFIFTQTDNLAARNKATLVDKQVDGTTYTFTFHTGSAAASYLESFSNFSSTAFEFMVTRSGRRNHLTTDAGQITALADPLSKYREDFTPSLKTTINAALVPFLNGLLSCNGDLVLPQQFTNQHGQTVSYQEFDLKNQDFYNFNGEQTDVMLSHYFDGVRIEHCNTGNSCFQGYGTSMQHIGYEVQFKAKGSSQFDHAKACHCIARAYEYDASTNTKGVPIKIRSFSVNSDGNILTEYENFNATVGPFNDDCYPTTAPAYYATYIKDVLSASAVKFKDTWNTDVDGDPCNSTFQASVNPYADGFKGIWRPWKNYYYKDERKQTDDPLVDNDQVLREDGVYLGQNNGGAYDHRFYEFVWKDELERPLNTDYWIPNQTITKYNRQGFEVENRDIAGFYSASIYGYSGDLPIAVASNARYEELYAANFESQYAPENQNLVAGDVIESDKAHSGSKSLHVNGSSTYESRLKPLQNKKYHLSAWLSVPDGMDQTSYTYKGDPADVNRSRVIVHFYDQNGTEILPAATAIEPSGEIIEGWQKVEGNFTTPNENDLASIRLEFISGDPDKTDQNPAQQDMLWDDIRVFPEDGNMLTHVYDEQNYRLKATLDQNNFATFYEYDSEGNLFLVRKETPRGIMTLQESRSYQVQQEQTLN